ncbi:hypothetical protein AWV80_06215 [Cupriavidus sp. UYMU48A]|nr:hypothetical protein AWV80_06215 [Cupriavidus sp. UYMU48A]
MRNRSTTVIAFQQANCTVRWHFRFQISLRDIEELLFERGVAVSLFGATAIIRRVLCTTSGSDASQARHHMAP